MLDACRDSRSSDRLRWHLSSENEANLEDCDRRKRIEYSMRVTSRFKMNTWENIHLGVRPSYMSTRDNICLWHVDELMNVEVTVSISYDMFPLIVFSFFSLACLSFTFVRLRLNFNRCARGRTGETCDHHHCFTSSGSMKTKRNERC